MLCRLASGPLHHPASYTPGGAAWICVYFLSPSTVHKGHDGWFGPPTHESDSRSGAPGPPSLLRSHGGSPTSTGLGIMADADQREEVGIPWV
ncbi:unnamed protein product [Rhizoctonia solani]|uniref:Uncharacterized protein n=1 Tax=Rhizoctonia solani TaxID=456999 RepID=A0A8H2W5H4_9AGAM|nr:unnamed protein product [Rhizoctonia solani]